MMINKNKLIGKKVFINVQESKYEYIKHKGIIKGIDEEDPINSYLVVFDKPIQGNTIGIYDRGWYKYSDLIFYNYRKEKLEKLIEDDE